MSLEVFGGGARNEEGGGFAFFEIEETEEDSFGEEDTSEDIGESSGKRSGILEGKG